MNLAKLCRSCMKELSHYDPEIFDQSTMNMFLFCINKQFQEAEEDQLPKMFCPDCNNKINSSYKFIKHAKDINDTLINLILQNGKIKNEIHIDDNNDNLEIDNETEMKADYLDNSFLTLNETEDLINADELEYYDETKDNYVCKNKKPEKVKNNSMRRKPYKQGLLQKNIDLQVYNIKLENGDNNGVKIDGIAENDTQGITVKDTINTSSELSCKVCKTAYTHLTYLKRHYKMKHGEIRNSKIKSKDIESLKLKDNALNKNRDLKQCPMCNRTFKLQTNFKNHIEREHSIFRSKHSLRYHKSKEHIEDKQFACNACDKRFRWRKGLAVHMLTHSKERPFICDTCNMSFKMKQVLIKHLTIHENDRRLCLCHICAKGFRDTYHLKEHMASHTKSHAFSCDVCSFTAAYRTTLRRHKLKHTGSRPYACPHCRQAFYDKFGLNRHMRIHTGEKPYKCPSCPTAFIDYWKRKIHIMRVHQVPFEEIPRLAADGQPVKKWQGE